MNTAYNETMTKKYIYKNTSGSEQMLMGVGIVEVDGLTPELAQPLENPNFELVSEKESQSENVRGDIPVTESKKRK